MIQRILLAAALLVGSQTLQAQQEQPGQFTEGKDYFKIEQASSATSDDSVEVTVVFSYLCSHCNTLEPYVESWTDRKPDNVKMNRIHVVFGRPHELMARGYIVAEMTGIADTSHRAMMDAIWKEGRRFRSPEDLADFYVKFGVEKDRFLANYNSFAADSQLRRSNRDVQLFGITGTPSIVVNRKYRIPNTVQIWDVLDYLVAMETATP
jgi:thiol:disulfide interchange protein DsbA